MVDKYVERCFYMHYEHTPIWLENTLQGLDNLGCLMDNCHIGQWYCCVQHGKYHQSTVTIGKPKGVNSEPEYCKLQCGILNKKPWWYQATSIFIDHHHPIIFKHGVSIVEDSTLNKKHCGVLRQPDRHCTWFRKTGAFIGYTVVSDHNFGMGHGTPRSFSLKLLS